MKKLILLDTHAIIHRAYHALPPFTSPRGEPVGAVYGFTAMLLRILRELKPDYIAAAFDLSGPTFRHVAYERYKAQRPAIPHDLAVQFEFVREILAAFGVPVLEKEGFEADDVIGTIAKKFEKDANLEIIVVTGDTDELQLIRPRLKVYYMKKGITDIGIYDEAAVRERFGFGPKALIDFKALKGDPSDNITGVKGIGEKTAADLIKKFGSLEKLYKELAKKTETISDSVRKKLLDGVEDAKISKKLATIHASVPIDFSLESARARSPEENGAVGRVLAKFGFTSLEKRIRQNTIPAAVSPLDAAQQSFDLGSAQAGRATPGKDGKKFFDAKGDVGVFVSHGALWALRRGSKDVYTFDREALSQKGLRALFQKPFFAYDGKGVIHFLRRSGIDPAEIFFDISIAGYLTSTFFRNLTPDALLARELGVSGGSDPGIFGRAFFPLADRLAEKLQEGKLRSVFDTMEMPLIRILADMEDRGVLLDSGFLRKLSREAAENMEKLKKEIFRLAGEEFNVNSTQQLSRILFEKMKIGTAGLRKTEKGGKISTRESELEKLKTAHPIIEKILAYRELGKLTSTYIDVLPLLVNPKTGRIHTTFNQTGTSTGRLSSQNPNLQNIPILSEFGREIRKAFVAAPGHVLASFDYSQIELRVAAHMARDEKMIAAFKQGLDIHTLTASEVYNIPITSVTPELRRQAKTLNFGILYGMGAQALAEATGMARDKAQTFIDEYFKDFSGIARYIQETKELAEAQGFVETLFGRRRWIPEIHSSNWRVKREAERMAVNMPIQGCLPYGTRILTSCGFIPIGVLNGLSPDKRPKFVWDGNKWRRYRVLNRGKARLAEIRLKNGQILRCDTRHIVLVATDDGYEWRHFDDIKQKDLVCISFPQKFEFEPPPEIKTSFTPSAANGRSFIFSGPDEDFWYWIGYYYGDGGLSTRILPYKNNYVRTVLTYVFGHTEGKKLQECKKYFERLGLRVLIRAMAPTTVRGHKRFVLSIESRGLGMLLDSIGIKRGATAKTKRFPSIIFRESLENRKSFLRGFLDAYGWYGRNSRDPVAIHLCQKKILEDTLLLLKTLGVPSKIRGPYKNKGQISFRLDVSRAFLFETFFGQKMYMEPRIGSSVPKFMIHKFLKRYPDLKKEIFSTNSDYVIYRRLKKGGTCSLHFFKRFIEKYGFVITSPLYDLVGVASKRVLKRQETTYTLSVQSSHRFDSEGVISKNTATGDIVKLAMIKIDEWVRKEKLEDKIRMLLQVHDELLFEIKKEYVEEAKKRITALMENAAHLDVPLSVNVSVGSSWGK